jgi:DNA polymerase-3 subunit gamma/tau
MLAFLAEVCAKEGAAVAPEGLALITRAAEGSMRDALSLLDQAIAHGGGPGAATDAAMVRAMLGLADRARTLDLFEAVMRGDAGGALRELGEQYAGGADPLSVLRDLAELSHWISVLKITPEAADDPTIGSAERDRGLDLAARLPMRALARAWQMLLKALAEVAQAPSQMMAAEMALIRLTHVADLPSPEDLVRRLTDQAPAPAAPRPRDPGPGGGGGGRPMAVVARAEPAEARALPAAAPPVPAALSAYATFEDVVGLIRTRRDARLLVQVETYLRLARYAPGRIDFEPAPGAPEDLAGDLTRRLTEWTGTRWVVSVVGGGGAATVAEVRRGTADTLRARAADNPLVAAALALFPGAAIKAVRPLAPEAGPHMAPDGEAAYDFDDNWEPVDPFDED